MSTGVTTQQTASRGTLASATYSVTIVSSSDSPIATGQMVIDSNPDNTLTGALELVGWPLIPLHGSLHNVAAIFPTLVLSLAGSGEGQNCSLVIEQVLTPLPAMCGVAVLTQNNTTTMGVVLFQPPA